MYYIVIVAPYLLFFLEYRIKTAIEEGRLPEIQSFGEIDLTDFVDCESKKTVLHFAVDGGKTDILNHLLEVISNEKVCELLHHQDAHGKTVFHYIAAIKNGDVVEEVLQSINKCNFNWSDALSFKCKKKKTICHYAIQNKNFRVLKHISDVNDFTVDEQDDEGQNYIHYFCRHFPNGIHFSEFLKKIPTDDGKNQRLATSPTSNCNKPPLLFAMENCCNDGSIDFLDFLKAILKLHKFEDLVQLKSGQQKSTLIMHAIKRLNGVAKNCFFDRLLELKHEHNESFETLKWEKNEENQTILNVIFDEVDDRSLNKLLEIISKEKCKEILEESKPLTPSHDIKGFEMVCKISGMCN